MSSQCLRPESDFPSTEAYKEYLSRTANRNDGEDEEMVDSPAETVLDTAFDDCDNELTRSILQDCRLIAQANQLQLVSDMFRICPISAEPVKAGGVLASAVESSASSCRSDSESSMTDVERRLERVQRCVRKLEMTSNAFLLFVLFIFVGSSVIQHEDAGMSIVLGNKMSSELPSHSMTVRGHTADTGQPVSVPLRLGGFEETDWSPINGTLELQNEELVKNGGIRIRAEPFFDDFTETITIPSDMPFSKMSAVPGLPEVAEEFSRRSVDVRKELLEPAAREYVRAYGSWSKAAEARQRELLELSGVFGHKQTDLIRALDTTPYDRDDKKTFEHRIRQVDLARIEPVRDCCSEGFGGGCSIMNARARGRQHPRMPEALKGTSSSGKTEVSSDRDTPRNQSGRNRRRTGQGSAGKDTPTQAAASDDQQQQKDDVDDDEAEKRAVIPDLEIFDYSTVGSSVAFLDTNREVPDLAAANREYFLQLTQPTDADIKKFLERLVSFPKDFRRMAAGSDRLTTGQMIEIYFRYKNLLGCKTMLSGSLRSQTCKHIARKEIKRTMYYLSKAADKIPQLCPRAPPVGAHGRPSRYYTHEFLRCLEQNSLRYNPHRRRAILNIEDDNSIRGKLEEILATAVASHCLDWADLEAVAQRRYRPPPFASATSVQPTASPKSSVS
ncbi:hypothetical protein FOL47_004384 [Perkinsus chesapeaki]|uniref:Uncharacterized protein n=1 Tax=Perkinsus chesapeaki TaxID=330153 RepID=A0A7J6MZ78_PERCH|nr:hypothetical protein FOL47_004384 [Perkinsus chesapeaki]